MVTGTVVAVAAGALLCAGCQVRGEARDLSGEASGVSGESRTAASGVTPLLPAVELWPSWVAIQLAGSQDCPREPKTSGCAWLFSTDGLEWVPTRLWPTEAQARTDPQPRHLTAQWCSRSGCRVVNVYLGPASQSH